MDPMNMFPRSYSRETRRRMIAGHVAPTRYAPFPTYRDETGKEVTEHVAIVATQNDPSWIDNSEYLTTSLRNELQHPIREAYVQNAGTQIRIETDGGPVTWAGLRGHILAYTRDILRYFEREDIYHNGFKMCLDAMVNVVKSSDGSESSIPFRVNNWEINHPITAGSADSFIKHATDSIDDWMRSKNNSFGIVNVVNIKFTFQELPAFDTSARGSGRGRRRYIVDRYVRRPISVTPGFVGHWVPAPANLAHKHAIINIKNEDEKCFLWASILAVKNAECNTHPEKVAQWKKYEHSLFNLAGIKFPFEPTIDNLQRIEEMNPLYAWNIMQYNADKLTMFPVWASPRNGVKDGVDRTFIELIYFNNPDHTQPHKWHFAWIKSMDKLFSNTRVSGVVKFCWICRKDYSDKLYERHLKGCHPRDPLAEPDFEFMDDDKKLSFALPKFMTGLKPPTCVMYADFECFTNRGDDKNTHIASGFSVLARAKVAIHPRERSIHYNELSNEEQRADDMARIRHNHFRHTVTPYKTVLFDHVRKTRPKQDITRDFNDTIRNFRYTDVYQQAMYKSEKFVDPPVSKETYLSAHQLTEQMPFACEVCGTYHTVEAMKYEWDRISGLLYGLICTSCYTAFSKRPSFMDPIPVFFHNGSRYDFHFVIKGLEMLDNEINSAVGDGEVFKSFTIGRTKNFGGFQFLDTLRFVTTSLEKLTETLVLGGHDFPLLRDAFDLKYDRAPTETDIQLCNAKGVFPYEWSSLEHFADTKLPSKEDFFSSLRNEHISDHDYERAQAMWSHFGFETFGEYHDFYMNLDVMQLAEFFEAFRANCWRHYGLDPAKFLTSPSLFFAAAMFKSRVVLDYVKDEEMQRMFERTIRGGMSIITHRLAEIKTNTDDPGCIRYWDANNLYGWAMLQPLPTGNFQTERHNNMNRNYQAGVIQSLLGLPLNTWADPESDTGAFFEVDLAYPPKLHDMHRDYPLAPHHMEPEWRNLSKYSRSFWSEPKPKKDVRDEFYTHSERMRSYIPYETLPPDEYVDRYGEDHLLPRDDPNDPYPPKPVYHGSSKLCATFFVRNKYMVHARNLKLYLELGMQIIRVHSVTTFSQAPWMREYILGNGAKRQEADARGDAINKDLFKLANNAVFGKMCENIRDFKEVTLYENPDYLLQFARDKGFDSPVTVVREAYEATGKGGLYILAMKKQRLLFDRPIFVGAAILELSKLCMFDFHYNCVKRVFGESCRLLMTDTDSLVYHFFNTKNPDQDIINAGLGGYLALQANGRVDKITPGLMKNEYDERLEANGNDPAKAAKKTIVGFVGLRAKTYALRFADEHSVMKAKAITGRAMASERTNYDVYREVLMRERKDAKFSFKSIQSRRQVVKTVDINRIGLAASDDKRYIMDNGIHSVPYGYNPNRMECESDYEDSDDPDE